ncbi:MAG: NCS2 family permease [Acidobacteria bacterium]|nr:NCS2 family permease [Acidobacteriota bacterium]
MNLSAWVERLFARPNQKLVVRTEVRAGIATFLTLSYILFVNPSILSSAFPGGAAWIPQLMTTTALSAAVGCFLMAFLARYPFALAPGMGLNAYFSYTLIQQQGIPWQAALGAVLISGLFFTVISLTGLREKVFTLFPRDLMHGTAAGIGLFLALIGCNHAGWVVAHPATLVGVGDFSQPAPLLALAGFLLMAVLHVRKVPGSILIGILAITAASAFSGLPVFEGHALTQPRGGWIQWPVWPKDLFLQLDLSGALEVGMLGIVFSFLFVDFFDTAGTLVGLSSQAGLLDKNGQLPGARAAFTSDALATMVGACLGTSTTTTYIESAAGIEEGGRTGLTAAIVGCCFLLCLFLWPLASIVPQVATAPALILIGCFLMMGWGRIQWDQPATAIPAAITVITMPLTFSIATGISFGIASYVLINLLCGSFRKLNVWHYSLTVLILLRFAYLQAG